MKQKQSWTERTDLWLPRGERFGGGMGWEAGISRWKLLHVEWRDKGLLYSTENYIRYPMTNHEGKEC